MRRDWRCDRTLRDCHVDMASLWGFLQVWKFGHGIAAIRDLLRRQRQPRGGWARALEGGAARIRGAEPSRTALRGEVQKFMAIQSRRIMEAPIGGRALLTVSAALAFSLAALGAAGPAFAQKKGEAKKEAAPAPAAAAAPAEKQSAWVKLCETARLTKKDAEGKDVPDDKKICLTHHERLDGNTGMVLVSAAIREVEGQDKKSLMVMVPLGMAIPPGVRAAVYTADQWAKAAKNEKIDEAALKPINLKYSLCHPAGCTAEIEAEAAFIDQMKAGGGIMILALNAAAQPIGFPVPLDGFTAAFDGPPIDNEKYSKARGELMGQIRQRQAQMVEKMKEEQKAKADAAKLLDPPPGGAPAAEAAPAPAEKKKK